MPVASSPTGAISIEVPNGTRLEGGNQQVLCTPSSWTDVATFFLANYVSHAATLKSLPGESPLSALRNIVLSLVFPISGVKRGLNAIFQSAIFAKTPLGVAAKANALCMVIRAPDWKPEPGDVVEMTELRMPWTPWEREDIVFDSVAKRVQAKLLQRIMGLFHFISQIFTLLRFEYPEDEKISKDPVYLVQPDQKLVSGVVEVSSFEPSTSNWDVKGRTVHGVCQLPPGYTLCTVPLGSQIVEINATQHSSEHQLDKDPNIQRKWREMKIKSDHKEKVKNKDMQGSFYSHLRSKFYHRRPLRRSSSDGIHDSTTRLSSNNGFTKGLIAIFQTFYASVTLYQARGDQIQRFGYAAFGLTVVPYLVMSLVNLASNILTPDYSAVYLVESDTMEEAKKRGNAAFEGVVGRIVQNSISNEFSEINTFDFDSDGRLVLLRPNGDANSTEGCEEKAEMIVTKHRHDPWTGSVSALPTRRPYRMISRSNGMPSRTPSFWNTVKLCAMITLVLIPLGVNGALSHFKPYQSTVAQRVWTMTWLALGSVANGASDAHLGIAVCMLPAIGGFVVVSQMITEYGNCVKLT